MNTSETFESGTVRINAGKGIRVGAYLIDVIPAIFMGLLGLIPLIGPILAGCLLLPYWLLRDIFGGSFGKVVLGLRVVGKDGQPVSKGALMARNLPLIIGPALMVIPFLGYLLGPAAAFVMIVIEAICLLACGERIGDKMAGTVVVQR
jgi:uncharacterized RDD family membrane protein YckC